MNFESQPLDPAPEGKPQKSKAVDLLQAFGCGLLILGSVAGFSRLNSLLVTIPPLSWIPSGKSGPASNFFHYYSSNTPLYWLILIALVFFFIQWRRKAKFDAMDSDEKAKARLKKRKMALVAISLGLPLLWLFEGFDTLKTVLAFLIVFSLVIGVAVAISRWRRKKKIDEPPGVKVI
jgi:hypothetical protein